MSKETINKLHKKFLLAMKAGDTALLATLLTDDVIFCPPHEHTRKGKQEVMAWARQVFSQVKTYWLSVSDRKVALAGDRAFESGSFVSAVAPAEGGETTRDHGRFLTIWQRQSDGSWRVAYDIWNSSGPLPSAQSTPNAPRHIETEEPVTL